VGQAGHRRRRRDERGQLHRLAGRQQLAQVGRGPGQAQDRLACRSLVAAGDDLGQRCAIEEDQLTTRRAQPGSVVRQRQVVVAQPLADVPGQDRQTRQRGLWRPDELSAERRVRHGWQVGQQGAQRGARRLWDTEPGQIVQADVQQVVRDAD